MMPSPHRFRPVFGFRLLALSVLTAIGGCDALVPEPVPEVELTPADLGALEAMAGCDVFPTTMEVIVSGRVDTTDCTFDSITMNLHSGDPDDAHVAFIGFRIDEAA